MNFLPSDMNVSIPDPNSRSLAVQKIHVNHGIGRQMFTRSPIAVDHSSVGKAPRKKRKIWSKEEDLALSESVKAEYSSKMNWTAVAERVNKGSLYSPRTGKQCRERWQNHLRPNLKKGDWSEEEEKMIQELYQTFGPKWTSMSKLLSGRTDNDIKNKWNSMQRTQKALRRKESQLPLKRSQRKTMPSDRDEHSWSSTAVMENEKKRRGVSETIGEDAFMILEKAVSEGYWDCFNVPSSQV